VTNQGGESKSIAIVATGRAHSLVIALDGSLWVWGGNSEGELGLGDSGDRTQRNVPTRVGAESDWALMSASDKHTLAIKKDGSLWAWGENEYGPLGLGESGVYNRRTIPTRVGLESDWAMVSTSWVHTHAIKNDGSLWAWGYSSVRLGLGVWSGNQLVPIRVGAESDWAMVSAGFSCSLAIKKDGSLWAWGYNNDGGLGLGDTTDRSVPTRVGSESDWAMVSVGYGHTLAIKKDGSLWAWGNNSDAQLGLGDENRRLVPTRVGAESDWVAISTSGTTSSSGTSHSLAIKKDGSLWAWGNNRFGGLGLGDTTRRFVPTHVGAESDWAMISAGYSWSLAIKKDGSLWAWGYNRDGQLGLGDTTDRNVPTRVIVK
jgi:alpha-tubulin suppressor-like RCC1 family protein